MGIIKVSRDISIVALDVYGTILATNDGNNEMPARKGFNEFLERCKQNNLIVSQEIRQF